MQIEGVVIQGHQLGRTLGFPTANIVVPATLDVTDGVYRSRVQLEGVWYDAMSNLGCNPSVGGSERRLETHIFGYEGVLYGCRIRVELLEKIREERKFDSLDELRNQIARDRESVLAQIERLNC